MTIELMQDFIARHSWRWDKKRTHQYVRIYDVDSRRDFLQFCKHIEETPDYTKFFYGYHYQYVDVDEYQYWTRSNEWKDKLPLDKIIILNRAKLKETT